jgi:Arc/MetJ family transcription regulator
MQTPCQVYRLPIKLIFSVYRREEAEKVTHLVIPITEIDIFVTKFRLRAGRETDLPRPIRHRCVSSFKVQRGMLQDVAEFIGYSTPIHIDMGAHMKTTIEISDALFATAKTAARNRQTTMRALVEEGLRRILSEASNQSKPVFKLKDASVHGQEVLLPNPLDWQQQEEDHVISRNILGVQ